MPPARRRIRDVDDAIVKCLLAAEPTAIGGPVSILKSGDVIVKAFIHAGILALVTISLLLWLTLRRVVDVLMTLVPLNDLWVDANFKESQLKTLRIGQPMPRPRPMQ